ncbi:MAG: winged helix-turn-helix transcriptional regulator [Candidatus Omnitrophica bacterium]|nr:winged helix-turn-helix transcriptional regulator [Candidatus Omnitrophota bacterium]
MELSTYRDMHLLDEVTRNPTVTQRELAKRIGVALGLANLMLRRLTKKGYIKISGTKRSRIRYLITPQGILEKSRLTYEFVQYSLQLYHRVRHFWREQLATIAQTPQRRILLFGAGELAEIAFLTIQEMGLDFVGVAQEAADERRFLGYPVQDIRTVAPDRYDWMLVTALQDDGLSTRLQELGVPPEQMIVLTRPGQARPAIERRSIEQMAVATTAPVPVPTAPVEAEIAA